MEIFSPETDSSGTLDALYDALTQSPLPEAPRLIANDGVAMELTPQVAQILKIIVTELHKGRSITVVAHDAKVTTQQAADHLGVSRPTLIKMLSDYGVAVETTGRHRRISFGALRDLEQKIKVNQFEKLQAMVAVSRQTGELDAPNFSNPLIK